MSKPSPWLRDWLVTVLFLLTVSHRTFAPCLWGDRNSDEPDQRFGLVVNVTRRSVHSSCCCCCWSALSPVVMVSLNQHNLFLQISSSDKNLWCACIDFLPAVNRKPTCHILPLSTKQYWLRPKSHFELNVQCIQFIGWLKIGYYNDAHETGKTEDERPRFRNCFAVVSFLALKKIWMSFFLPAPESTHNYESKGTPYHFLCVYISVPAHFTG